MITYRVDVYGSRPIGASLLTTSQFMVGYNVAKVVAAASTVGFLVNEEIRKLVAECERSVVCRPQNSVRWLKTIQTEISNVSVYRIVVNVVFTRHVQYTEAHADSFCTRLNTSKPKMFKYQSAFAYFNGSCEILCPICTAESRYFAFGTSSGNSS